MDNLIWTSIFRFFQGRFTVGNGKSSNNNVLGVGNNNNVKTPRSDNATPLKKKEFNIIILSVWPFVRCHFSLTKTILTTLQPSTYIFDYSKTIRSLVFIYRYNYDSLSMMECSSPAYEGTRSRDENARPLYHRIWATE